VSDSFDLEAPNHFTAGAVGAPGQRVFYLQARESRTLLTLKVEKEQVGALADYLAGLLARLPAIAGEAPGDLVLLEPVEAAWSVGALAVGYDEARDRIQVEAQEQVEEERAEEPATARFRITRAQAAAFVERARELIRAGRPICRLCGRPIDPPAHVCARSNGHIPR
jgi:uncharacterized repeat protein (TIGR03847 family)